MEIGRDISEVQIPGPKEKIGRGSGSKTRSDDENWSSRRRTFVDVGRVSLFPGLSTLLLLARRSGRGLLASLLLLSGGLASGGLSTSAGLLLCGFGRHFGWMRRDGAKMRDAKGGRIG
jgi:hypothetical protein